MTNQLQELISNNKLEKVKSNKDIIDIDTKNNKANNELPQDRVPPPQALLNDKTIFLEWRNINYHIKQHHKKPKLTKIDEINAVKDDIESKISPLTISENTENTFRDASRKTILQNISGFALPCEIVGILGPSGSGKTTLLNVIADRQLPNNKDHVIIKDVRTNGLDFNKSSFGQLCAYVMQEDILLPTLTVKESLLFGARLKLRTSAKDCEDRVNTLLQQVNQL